LTGAGGQLGARLRDEPGRFAPVSAPLKAALAALQYRHRILRKPPLA
jgi:hypothetical protein